VLIYLRKDECLVDLIQKLSDKFNEALLPADEWRSGAFSSTRDLSLHYMKPIIQLHTPAALLSRKSFLLLIGQHTLVVW
jgi:hypothetical protein